MRITLAGSAIVIACALTASSCNSSGAPASPSSLDLVSLPGSASGTFRPLDDPPPPPPTPDPTPAPVPAPPTPVPLMISIVGYYGATAYTPNPSMANVGDQIVFTNNDTRLHHIVLDDGTDLGDVFPGEASAPKPLATPTATFHCTIHPSMIGAINTEIVAPYEPPPPDNNYGYYGYYGN